MKQALRALYDTMQRGTQRRLGLAVFGMFLSGLMDVAGLAMIVPLMQLLTDPNNPSGISMRISSFLGDPSTSSLVLILAAVIFVAFIVKGAFSIWLNWWILGFLNHEAAGASSGLFRRYMGAPYTLHLQRNSAELLRTMNAGVDGSYVGAVNATMNLLTEAITAGLVLLVLLVARPVPAVAAIAYFGLIAYGFQHVIKRRARAAGDELMESNRQTVLAALQGLGGVKEILVRGTAPYFAEKFDRAKHRNADANRMQQFLSVAPRYGIEMMFILGVAVMSVAIFTTRNSTQGAATLGLFVAAGFRLLPSLSRMVSAVGSMRVNKAAVDLVLADLATLPPATETVAATEPVSFEDRLAVESVRFRYPGSDHDVLHGVSFDVLAGNSVAIVGSSGAGKTTVVDLILGLLEPTEGRLSIDGVDMADFKDGWQRSIGLVPQDVYLFDDTLRANIAFGKSDDEIDEDRLAEAVHRAQLDELMAELPDGLATVVGERGVRLSGGQLQRIGIARAMYLRPKLLVLDEATSALDNATERKVTSTIEALHGEVTMIVVAHRLSTVRRCDQLIFMSHGQIESIGTFDEVRNTNATFARLVRLGSLDSLETTAEVAS